MKNFSKVLALILVVATLFSFVAMTASAKEFEDSDKISYAEAVDVLSNIGIIDGYTNDTFRPTNNIKRSEMAKMIAVLSNAGKDDMGDLYAAACKFADVKGNSNWAKSYIAYCNQKGIVAGRNATTFDPEGKVTGIETAKMLLVVMGFDAETQGYVGTGWKTHVLADADKVGLLDNFAADFEPNSAITREEAAQMMLNALEAPMVVGTVSDNIVKVSNNVWINLFWRDPDAPAGVSISLTDAARIYDCFVLYGNVVVSPVPVYTSFTGLSREDAEDCYGNPVTRWSMENTYGREIWSESYEIAPDFYYTTAADLEGDLDILEASKVGNAWLYVDGQFTNYNGNLGRLINAAEAASGKGVETKVYLDTRFVRNIATADPWDITTVTDVRITVKNTYIGEVDYVTKGSNTFKLTTGNRMFDNAGYGFEEGDVILYWLCNETLEDNAYVAGNFDLHAAEIAVPVNVDLTDTYVAHNDTNANSYIMGSSKKYEYAKNFGNHTAGSFLHATYLDAGNNKSSDTFDLYLDKFGYMMAWNEVKPGKDTGYMYLVEDTGVYTPNGVTSGQGLLYTATATTVDFDAKMTEKDAIDVAAFEALRDYESGNWGTHYGYKDHGVLIRYEKDANGRKNLDVITNATGGVIDDGIAELAPTNVVLDKDGRLTWYNSGTIIATADNKTQFLIRTYDYVNGGFKYEALSKSELTMNYCGNLNTVSKEDRDDTVVANIQYFYDEVNGDKILTYVFVNALYSESNTARAFVLDETADISANAFVDVIGDYTAYDAYIGGERAILAITENSGATINDYGLYETKLTVIGLVHGNVPVYANVSVVNPVSELNDEACWVERNGLLIFYEGTATPIKPVDPTSDFFAVVCVENADGSMSYDTIKLENLSKLNDYVDTVNGVPTFPLNGGYDSAKSWAITSGNTISELYLYITVGQAD